MKKFCKFYFHRAGCLLFDRILLSFSNKYFVLEWREQATIDRWIGIFCYRVGTGFGFKFRTDWDKEYKIFNMSKKWKLIWLYVLIGLSLLLRTLPYIPE